MTTTLPQTAAAYVAINTHDADSFIACFADGAVVQDVGREFRGLAAIKHWADQEIFAAQVTVEVLAVAERDGRTMISTRVDGTFDKTGLPDPLILNHHFAVEGGKIAGLTIRLAGEEPGT